MIYTKAEIAPGVNLNVNIDTDELYANCPCCGIEHNVDYELAIQLEEWSSSISCGNKACNEYLRERNDDL